MLRSLSDMVNGMAIARDGEAIIAPRGGTGLLPNLAEIRLTGSGEATRGFPIGVDFRDFPTGPGVITSRA